VKGESCGWSEWVARTCRDETVDGDSIFLSEAIGPFARLGVGLGVPIGVVEDDSIGACQIQSYPARLCGHQHAKIGFVRVEAIHHGLSMCHVGVPVHSTKLPFLRSHKGLDDVQHLFPLAKN